MEIVLIRHGQTAGNLAGRYIGRTDEPLCPEGIAAVRGLGCLPDEAVVYVSPMRRTRETAALLFPSAEPVIVPDLREMDFGDFEGRSAAEMADDAAYRTWVDGLCMDACPNGENRVDFTARTARAFDGMIQDAIRRSLPRLFIVAHGGTIMAIMETFGRPRQPYYSWQTPNAGGFRARLDEKTWPADPALTQIERLEVLGR